MYENRQHEEKFFFESYFVGQLLSFPPSQWAKGVGIRSQGALNNKLYFQFQYSKSLFPLGGY